MVEIESEETKIFVVLEILILVNSIPNIFAPGKTHSLILIKLKRFNKK